MPPSIVVGCMLTSSSLVGRPFFCWTDAFKRRQGIALHFHRRRVVAGGLDNDFPLESLGDQIFTGLVCKGWLGPLPILAVFTHPLVTECVQLWEVDLITYEGAVRDKAFLLTQDKT